MTKTIQQSVTLPASARTLYRLFTDPKLHAAFTGSPSVAISSKPGAKFSAFNHMIWGSTLHSVPGQLLIQRWRSAHFKTSDLDSILILQFTDLSKNRARIDLAHVNVPPQDHTGVANGWKKYYWQPVRRYLAQR